MNEWQLEGSLSARLMAKLLLWGYRGALMQHWPLLTDTDRLLEESFQNWFVTGTSLNFLNIFLLYLFKYFSELRFNPIPFTICVISFIIMNKKEVHLFIYKYFFYVEVFIKMFYF